jgi:hypothetical protein
MLGQSVNLHEYFDDIHKRTLDEFKRFYIFRQTTLAPSAESELSSFLTSLTISDIAPPSVPDSTGAALIDFTQAKDGEKPHRAQTVTIVAPKGSGKTTFLHHYFRIELADRKTRFPDTVFATPIFDFREKMTAGTIRSELDIKKEICRFLDEFFIETLWPGSLREKHHYYENVYKLELRVFVKVLLDSGLSDAEFNLGDLEHKNQRECIQKYKSENPFEFIKLKIDWYKKLFPNLWVIISVDNVDHHLPENPGGIIAIFQQLKEMLDIVDLIFTLRDTSFLQLNSIVRHDAWGGLRVITLEAIDMAEIGAPRVRSTLSQARSRLNGEQRDLLQEVGAQAIVGTPDYRRPGKFNFEIVWSWIQQMTNHNYRFALDLLTRALRSFHLFDDNFERERYTPARRFDRGGIHAKKMKTALINGLELFYSSQSSGTPVLNLFDGGDAKLKGNHIIRIKMLQYMQNRQRFMIDELAAHFSNVFGKSYAPIIRTSIFEMVVKGLIIVVNESQIPLFFGEDFGGINKFEDVSHMIGRIGACGKFHLNELLDDDIYLDEMKYATDFDHELYSKIFDMEKIPEKSSTVRKNSTRRFIKEILNLEDRFDGWSRTLGVAEARMKKALNEYEVRKSREEWFSQRSIAE